MNETYLPVDWGEMEIDVPASSPCPSPSRANYGFSLYLASTTAFYIFLTWGLMPASFLQWVYLPQVYWAVAVPVYCLVALALVGILIYPALNLRLTPPPEHPSILKDSYTLSQPPPVPREVPPMYDIPMTTVSRILYLDNPSWNQVTMTLIRFVKCTKPVCTSLLDKGFTEE